MLSDERYNSLVTNIVDKIPTNCDAYERVRKSSSIPSGTLSATTFQLSDFEAYRNDIEFVNSFPSQVLLDEENYFVKKYSRDLYNFLLTQRVSYMDQQKIEKEKLTCTSWCDQNGKECKFDPSLCDISNNTLNRSNNYVDQLLKENPIENPATTLRKVEYRKESHETLSTINQYMTYLYYILLVSILVLFAVSGQLYLMNRFVIYLFMALLPILFPYLFDMIASGFVSLSEGPLHGPKNAFLDTTTTLVDAHNI